MNRQESIYQYTASLMDEALLLLLEQKDYDLIAVKEVCQKAGVNRSTFYLHYESMDDLLEETVSMINDRFKSSLSSVPADDPSKVILTSEGYLRPYLGFIKDNMRCDSRQTGKIRPSICKRLKAFEKICCQPRIILLIAEPKHVKHTQALDRKMGKASGLCLNSVFNLTIICNRRLRPGSADQSKLFHIASPSS